MAEVSGAAWYKVWFHTRFPFFLCSSDHWFPFSCSDTPNLSLSQDLCAWLFFPQIFTSLAPSPHPDYNSDVRFSGRPFLTLLLKVIHLWVIFLHCVFQTVGYGPLLVGIEISLMGLFFFFFLRNGDAQLLKKKIIYFWLRWVFVAVRAFSSCREQGVTLSCSERASRCSGFSCCKAQALGRVGFSSCGTQAQ